jgi:molybdopterin synthase catalytic subunit
MIRVQRKDISLDSVVSSLQTPAAGALVVFVGTVRADPGLTGLEYEVYDGMAEPELVKLRREAMDRFNLLDLAIVHRSGLLKVGERVVAVAAAAPHRREAFEGCSWTIDALKKVVPIWKEEVFGP